MLSRPSGSLAGLGLSSVAPVMTSPQQMQRAMPARYSNPGAAAADALLGDPAGPAALPVRPTAVLQVLPALVSGGVERGTVDVAAALADAGWTALVASAGGPMVRQLQRAGAPHLTLPLDRRTPR